MNAGTLRWELRGLTEHLRQLFSGWEIKAAIGIVLAYLCNAFNWYSTFFGGNAVLLWLLVILAAVDILLGVTQAMITGWFTPKAAYKIVHKIIIFSLYVAISSVGCLILRLSIGYGVGLLDALIGSLAGAELLSIVKNLEKMGIVLPYPLPELAHAVYKKIGRHTAKEIKDLNNERDIQNPD